MEASSSRTTQDDVESQVGPVQKEKRTRRRLRLSCVECTKRRQKCDRQYPCGLCKSRGVPDLCRWENVPVARPTPARPPTIPGASASSSSSAALDLEKDKLIRELQSKVSSLEKRLDQQNHHLPRRTYSSSPSITSGSSSSPSASRSLALTHLTTPSPSPAPAPAPTSLSDTLSEQHLNEHLERLPQHPPAEAAPELSDLGHDLDLRRRDPFARPLAHIGPSTYATTSALAQLCTGHFGEFTGRGSLVCALHFISTGVTPRFLYAKSTESTSTYHSTEMTSSFLSNRMEHIISTLPSRHHSLLVARRFFEDHNYLFGIPETWFWRAFEQMWGILERPGHHGMQVNACFLVLFFAIMAYTPDEDLSPTSSPPTSSSTTSSPTTSTSTSHPHSQSQGQSQAHSPHISPDPETRSSQYFIAATEARRIAEDNHLNLPNLSLMVSAADGITLLCLSIPILATWLTQRGRASEGWKLVGTGLRYALGVGLHRDPGWEQWCVMSEEEGLLRRVAWWGLFTRDKLFSFFLGRQHMIRPHSFDVRLPYSSSTSSTSATTSPTGHTSSPNPNLNPTPDTFTPGLGLELIISLSKLAGTVIETCFSMQLPEPSTYFVLGRELEEWEGNLPSSFHAASTSSSPQERSHPAREQQELETIRKHRYTLLTWNLWMRIKLQIACLARPGLGWEMYEESARRCVGLCLRLGRMQVGVWEEAKGLAAGGGSGSGGGQNRLGGGGGGGGGGGSGTSTQSRIQQAHPTSSYAAHLQPQPPPLPTNASTIMKTPLSNPSRIGTLTYPGPVFFFEGTFSLLESTVIALTVLTRHPYAFSFPSSFPSSLSSTSNLSSHPSDPRNVLREADSLANEALRVLEEVGESQPGRKGEVARLGKEVVGRLRGEEWWRGQVGGAVGKGAAMPDRVSVPTSGPGYGAGQGHSKAFTVKIPPTVERPEHWEPSLLLSQTQTQAHVQAQLQASHRPGQAQGVEMEMDFGPLGGYDLLANETYTNLFGFRNEGMFMEF